MGRDRRKRDRRQAADVDSANNNIEINTTTDAQTPLEPRGQREPRNKAGQESREVAVKKLVTITEKPATENLSGKKEENKEAPPDPAVQFANLKRETDDIKALTEKKYAKRQIFSNWSRYDKALQDPVQEEEEFLGADFKALCANVTFESSYFQLKSERSWDTHISALSSELFSLNADILAASLGCIPFYERLDLPITLFSEADVQKMKSSAKTCKDQYESSKSSFYKELDILNILRERSNAEDILPLKGEREKTPNHKPILSFSIDRPETPDELERSTLTEKCEQAHSMPPRATRFSADIARKGSPEIVSKVTSKIPETYMTPQDFRKNRPSPEKQESNLRTNRLNPEKQESNLMTNRLSPEKQESNLRTSNLRTNRLSPEKQESNLRTNRLSPEKQESNLQDFKENVARHSAEISFNAVSQSKEINTPTKRFVEDRSPGLVEKVEPSGKEKELFEEINGDFLEKLNLTPQSQTLSPDTEKIKHFDKEANDDGSEMSSSVVQQSESVPEKAVESIPNSVAETLPLRQINKNKSKEKKKRHALKMATISKTAADSEAASLQTESKLKSETKTVSDVAVHEDMRHQEEVQKPPTFVESLGQRSKKRKSKEKGQHANKPIENAKMPTQEKPEITKALAGKKQKPVAQEIAIEKAKSPSPGKSFAKTHSAPQAKSATIVKPKQEKIAESAKILQEKPVEKVELEEEKSVQKVKSEKPTWKIKPREDKVEAPAQKKAERKFKQDDGDYYFDDDDDDDDDDDLDFLLSLSKSISESEATPGVSTKVSKPSVEEDDTSAKTAPFTFPQKTQDLKDHTSAKRATAIFPQQTQELEDWLDSVLND